LDVSPYSRTVTTKGGVEMTRSGRRESCYDKDQGFQESILSMLEWVADRDPVKAASLINAYLDELAEEMGVPGARAAHG
jgi:hypothetical protein